MLLLLSFSFFMSVAQECSCPVIQCDPCQKPVVLGTQKVMCSPEKSIVCKNVVCENVDNYFQCVAGAYPQHVPVEDALKRITDPDLLDAPVVIPPETFKAEFKHYDHMIETQTIDKEPSPQVRQRDLASLKSEKRSVQIESQEILKPQWPQFILRGSLAISADGAAVKKLKIFKTDKDTVLLKFPKAQSFWMDYAGASAFWKVSAGTEIVFSKEDSHLAIHPKKGDVTVDSIDAKDMLVIDAGLWRLGKSTGSVKIAVTAEGLSLRNKKGQAFLRKDQLIAKSESVDEGMELVISQDFGIVHSDKTPEEPLRKLQLQDLGASKRRVLASAAIDIDGCSNPRGDIQQCAWKCFGAKKKSKGCENTETTQCVRFMCSLGGEWKLPTRVSGKECKADAIVVDSCN